MLSKLSRYALGRTTASLSRSLGTSTRSVPNEINEENITIDFKHLLESVPDLTGRSLITLNDFTEEEVNGTLDVAIALKNWFKCNDTRRVASEIQPFLGRSVALIFQKRSTRTRLSMETGISKLGGTPIFLGSDDIQLGVNESLSDSARVISRFNDIIAARVFDHSDIEDLSALSDVPVINMLSDKFHPLQLLADMMTLREHYGDAYKGKTVAYVGDGNNMAHSFIVTCPKLGYNLRVASPKIYTSLEDVKEMGEVEAKRKGTEILFTEDAAEAVSGADVIVTDTWISMGQEAEKAIRLREFKGYQVTMDMAKDANKDWVFLHCLPRKPEEVDDEVFYSERSLVWDEAENRMWTAMAYALQCQGRNLW